MAIAKTGAMFKTLTFDSQSSRNYGVYITGEAVYNAPNRDVEMITIPGRNGAFAKDNGRFENIEVTYPAGIAADNEQDFANAISNFRNMLCARKGYCRLTDDYNSDEYRLAVYKSGLEVSPALLRAGEFEITFECKPQRFLTSGETKVAVANNGTISNPTLFPSKPKLEFNGYGDINIGSGVITVDNAIYGDVIVGESINNSYMSWSNPDRTQPINTNIISSGDVFFWEEPYTLSVGIGPKSGTITSFTIVSSDDYAWVNGTSTWKSLGIRITDFNFSYGTAASRLGTTIYSFVSSNGNTYSGNVRITVSYDGDATFTYRIVQSRSDTSFIGTAIQSNIIPNVRANSTKAVGNPKYIDLDIGEAWDEDSGYPVSINNIITIPPILPELSPGSNTISYSNTITNFKITPRWWKI